MVIKNTSGQLIDPTPPANKTRGPLGLNLARTPYDPATGKHLPLKKQTPDIESVLITQEAANYLVCKKVSDNKELLVYKPIELFGLSSKQVSPPYSIGSLIYVGKIKSVFADGVDGTEFQYVDLNVAGRRKSGLMFRNDSGEVIPANSVAEITGVERLTADPAEDGELFYTVVKPTEDNITNVVFIPYATDFEDEDGNPIYGSCSSLSDADALSAVNIDIPDPAFGTLAVGDTVGVYTDSWSLSNDNNGFIYLGDSDGVGFVRAEGGGNAIRIKNVYGDTIPANAAMKETYNTTEEYYEVTRPDDDNMSNFLINDDDDLAAAAEVTLDHRQQFRGLCESGVSIGDTLGTEADSFILKKNNTGLVALSTDSGGVCTSRFFSAGGLTELISSGSWVQAYSRAGYTPPIYSDWESLSANFTYSGTKTILQFNLSGNMQIYNTGFDVSTYDGDLVIELGRSGVVYNTSRNIGDIDGYVYRQPNYIHGLGEDAVVIGSGTTGQACDQVRLKYTAASVTALQLDVGYTDFRLRGYLVV